jgi:hypothetical protein
VALVRTFDQLTRQKWTRGRPILPKKPAIPGGAAAPLTFAEELEDFKLSLGDLLSTETPRPIVTPSGKYRVTGNLPNLKAIGDARFDSSLERSGLLVLSSATITRWLSTHPVVLQSFGEAGSWTYTPDVVASIHSAHGHEPTAFIGEFRARRWLETAKARDRVAAIADSLRRRGHAYVFLTDGDLPTQLVDEIELLLKVRPLAHRWRTDIDPDAWDPTGTTEPDPETARRWSAAQAECNALLRRVMKRDPGCHMAELATA